MERQSYEAEYIIRSSPSVLYKFIATAEGLSQWFADEVRKNDDVFTFSWKGAEEQARLESKKPLDFIRFKWLDNPENEYFEMKISKDEVGRGLALVITDFCEEDEVEDQKLLWDSQIDTLLSKIGSQR